MKKRKLGELLIERGSISYEHLTWALNEQRGKEILLGELLLSQGRSDEALSHLNEAKYLPAMNPLIRLIIIRQIHSIREGNGLG